MLGDKHRVPAKRRLLAVVGDNGRAEALADEIGSMGEYQRQAFTLQVCEILSAQMKAAAEAGSRERIKEVIKVSHAREPITSNAEGQSSGMVPKASSGLNLV